MSFNFKQIENILNTLPIGYYAGCRVPTSLGEKDECSFFNPIERIIVVSYKQISKALENAMKTVEISNFEPIVRVLLYHEVGHVILTPSNMRMGYVLNVFEDERIETVCKDAYINVDFKYWNKYIDNWDEIKNTAPETADNYWFRLVRYRQGDADFVKRVEEIIDKYYNINCKTDWWTFNDYENEVRRLYNEVCERFRKDKEKAKSKNSSDEDSESKKGNGETGPVENENMINSTNDKEDSAMMSKKDDGEESSKKEEMRKAFKNALNSCLNQYYDISVEKEISRIIESFNKKTNCGAALQAHSGIFNARNVVRNDYRFFDRISNNNGVNKFGAIHLNLFLDESGSYRRNQKKTNTLISALASLERRCKIFSFDIVYCGMSERVCKKENREMKCSGGNLLDDKIFKIFKDLQKPNVYNYNIVLFDGDAFTDAYYEKRENLYKNFGAFNHTNCTIISDYSNRFAIDNNAQKARRIYTSKYVEELYTNVMNALSFAFR